MRVISSKADGAGHAGREGISVLIHVSGRAVELEGDNRIDLGPIRLGNGNRDPLSSLPDRCRPAGEDRAAGDAAVDRRQRDGAILPVFAPSAGPERRKVGLLTTSYQFELGGFNRRPEKNIAFTTTALYHAAVNVVGFVLMGL